MKYGITKDLKIMGGNLADFLHYMDIEIDAYKSFIDKGEKINVTEQSKLDKKMSKMVSEGEHPQYVSHLFEYDDRVLFSMSNIHRNSQFLSIFSYLESHMKIFCQDMERYVERKVKFKDLIGSSYLEQGYNYITKVLEVDLSSVNKTWEKIKDLKKVRNCISHDNCYYLKEQKPYNQQALYKVLLKIGDKYFSISEHGWFSIKNIEIHNILCDLIYDFFYQIAELIDAKYFNIEPSSTSN